MAGGSHRRLPAGSHAQVVNLVGACLLMLLAGSTYSLSIFSPAMDALPGSGAGAGREAQHPLAGVWSSSLGLLSLVSAPAMLAAGLVLSATPIGGGRRSRVARQLSLASATCFGCLALAAAAASRRSAAALTLAVATQGVALGVYYLLAVELLAAWAPRRRTGLATGAGMTAFGAGGMVFAAVFAALVHRLGAVGAVYAAAALWAVPCLALTPWLSFPPDVDRSDAGGRGGAVTVADPAAPLLPQRGADAPAPAPAPAPGGRGYGSVPSLNGDGSGEQPRQWRTGVHPPQPTGPARCYRPLLREPPCAEEGDCGHATNGSSGPTGAAASSNGGARPGTRRTGDDGGNADGKAEPTATAVVSAAAPAAPPDGGGVNGTALTWSSLLTLHQFWLYMYVCLVGQLGYGACLPWFFSTTGVFFDNPAAAAAADLPLKFAVMNGVGIAARLAGGIAVDILVVPGSAWLWSGAKNSQVLLMVIQTGAFLTMAALSSAAGPGGFGAFFAALVTLYVAFSATAGNLAVLSREVFSPANGSAVFGVAAGLMMGVGEAVATGGIALLNFQGRRAAEAGTSVASLTADGVPRSAYNAYYLIAAAASAGALVATLATHRVEAAFEVHLPDGSVGVLVDVTDLASGADGSEAGAANAATAAGAVATSADASPAADDAPVGATMAVPVGAGGRPHHPARPLVAVPGSTLDCVNDSALEGDEWDSDAEEDDDEFTLVSSYKAAFSLRDRVYVARRKAVRGPATYAGPSEMDKARGPPV